MRFLRCLVAFVRQRRFTREFDEEVRFHLDHLEQRHRDAGLAPAAAAARARRQFGNPVSFREQAQDLGMGRWLVDAAQDLRYAARMLRRQAGFAAIAIATLALGIAANTAMFSVVRAVMLRPLPYRDPSRLVVVWDRDRRQKGTSKLFAQYRDFEQWRAHSRSLEHVAGITWAVGSQVMTGHGAARSVLAIPSTAGLFSLLGVAPHIGRTFEPDDLTRGCSLVLSHRFWQSVLSAPERLADLRLALDDRACTVVGVMPQNFVFFPEPTEMWVLITPADPLARSSDAVGGLAIVGRLAPGTTLAGAQAELQALSRQLDRGVRYGAEMEPIVYPLREELTFLAGANVRLSLFVLSGAVLAVLLIACVNVANLLLGRALGRQRELAVRAALGSGRGRIARQLLTESLMLSVLATALGVGLAAAAVRAFRYLNPIELPIGAAVGIDLPVLLFAAGLGLATALVFGLWPAWRMSQFDVQSGLLSRAGGGAVRRHHRAIAGLVAVEIAMSFVLLVGGGLLLESLVRFSSASLGFDPDGLVFATVVLPPRGYSTKERRAAIFDRAIDTLSADPDVERLALSTALPLRGGRGMAALIVDGRPAPVAGSAVPDVGVQLVTPEYFSVIGVPIQRGRVFSSSDLNGEGVAVINAATVGRYFANDEPLGKRIRLYGDLGPDNPWLTVVGVAANEKRHSPYEEMAWVEAPIVYRAFHQNPPAAASVLIRLRGGGAGRGAMIQRELTDVDSRVVVGEIETARHLVNRYLAYPQFRAAIAGAFAAVALLLALVGLYGVLSQLVAQRAREIGIRMALGATRRDVLRLVLGEGMRLTGAGLVAGCVVALWVSGWLANLLFAVPPHDPLMLGTVAALLLATSLLAVGVPAARAARADPLVAIRED